MGDWVVDCGIAKSDRRASKRIVVFRAGRSTMVRSTFSPGFPCRMTKTNLARPIPPCQKSAAARPEIVTIAKARPAFRARVRATCCMNAGSVGDEACKNNGIRSLATGPVAVLTKEKLDGGGGMLAKLARDKFR